MKVKQIKQRGEPVWLVDGKVNGKRQRMFFDTKPQAKDVTCQQWWIGLSNSDRIDMMNAFERSRSIGFSLLSAVDHFATAGSGKNFLKKCTLGEAVGYAYVDERVKADSPSAPLAISSSTISM